MTENIPEMYPECVIASWDALILLLDAENIELDPVPGWTCAQEAFAVVLSLMAYRIKNNAEICWVNKHGALEKQLDPGR